jgi:putative transposase
MPSLTHPHVDHAISDRTNFKERHHLRVSTLSGTRLYVLAVFKHSSRRIPVLSATAHPTAAWVTQTAKNLVMDLDDAGSSARFLIRDHDSKFPVLFDVILVDAGIQVCPQRCHIPRMNAIMERRIKTCYREPLDHTLIRHQQHLLQDLLE